MNGTVYFDINSECGSPDNKKRYKNPTRCITEQLPGINIETCPRHRGEKLRCIKTITFGHQDDEVTKIINEKHDGWIRFDVSNQQLVSKMSIQESGNSRIAQRVEVNNPKDFKKIHRQWKLPLRIKVEAESSTEKQIELSYFYVDQSSNLNLEEGYFCTQIQCRHCK